MVIGFARWWLQSSNLISWSTHHHRLFLPFTHSHFLSHYLFLDWRSITLRHLGLNEEYCQHFGVPIRHLTIKRLSEIDEMTHLNENKHTRPKLKISNSGYQNENTLKLKGPKVYFSHC